MEREDNMKSILGLYIIFGFGILWHIIPSTRAIVTGLTPLALLLAFAIILYPEIKKKNWNLISWLIIVSVVTYIIEVAGVSTSLIFGEYEYGKNLGVKVLEVPLIIGLNWVIIIWGSTELAAKLKVPIFFTALSAAILAVLLDLLIEPAASFLGYWSWEGDIIPLQNYIAWFIIAFIFSLSYLFLKSDSKSILPVHFYATQVLFFGMLNIVRI
jgi:bisanhydrobacterioruberin hydratase